MDFLYPLLSVYIACIALPYFKASRLWQEISFGQLIEYIRNNVNTKGEYKADAIELHFSFTEVLLLFIQASKKARIVLPEDINDIAEKAIKVSNDIIRPDCLIPQYGDNFANKLVWYNLKKPASWWCNLSGLYKPTNLRDCDSVWFSHIRCT